MQNVSKKTAVKKPAQSAAEKAAIALAVKEALQAQEKAQAEKAEQEKTARKDGILQSTSKRTEKLAALQGAGFSVSEAETLVPKGGSAARVRSIFMQDCVSGKFEFLSCKEEKDAVAFFVSRNVPESDYRNAVRARKERQAMLEIARSCYRLTDSDKASDSTDTDSK